MFFCSNETKFAKTVEQQHKHCFSNVLVERKKLDKAFILEWLHLLVSLDSSGFRTDYFCLVKFTFGSQRVKISFTNLNTKFVLKDFSDTQSELLRVLRESQYRQILHS